MLLPATADFDWHNVFSSGASENGRQGFVSIMMQVYWAGWLSRDLMPAAPAPPSYCAAAAAAAAAGEDTCAGPLITQKLQRWRTKFLTRNGPVYDVAQLASAASPFKGLRVPFALNRALSEAPEGAQIDSLLIDALARGKGVDMTALAPALVAALAYNDAAAPAPDHGGVSPAAVVRGGSGAARLAPALILTNVLYENDRTLSDWATMAPNFAMCDLRQCDVVLASAYSSVHFVALAIDLSARCAHVFDSLHAGRKEPFMAAAKTLLRWVQRQGLLLDDVALKDAAGWPINYHAGAEARRGVAASMPVQGTWENSVYLSGHDCAVFVGRVLTAIAFGEPLAFTQRDVIVADFRGQFAWAAMNVKGKTQTAHHN